MKKKIIIVALVFGLTSIILGAFGAHSLKKHLTEEALSSFEVGVRYQMYHALFLLLLSNLDNISEKIRKATFISVVFGVLFFSGSIYLLSTESITSINIRSFALITPLGGLLLMLGWAFLLIEFLKKK
ncbi:DUF423 domain-containing protein [Capnocytophaga felis]|uniref:Membrane protein n=1 Tax=Capnocytophaga felis TaxID=2267611 RepID=A0A5M4B6T6_9FLAO|nr:DUF423 domain-containing protein [Capnocytophaga felis]GET45321.1 membrane protein [Capnocytophaga felis]GET47516.1 membrane protein [Capnocytophaga felis]